MAYQPSEHGTTDGNRTCVLHFLGETMCQFLTHLVARRQKWKREFLPGRRTSPIVYSYEYVSNLPTYILVKTRTYIDDEQISCPARTVDRLVVQI